MAKSVRSTDQHGHQSVTRFKTLTPSKDQTTASTGSVVPGTKTEKPVTVAFISKLFRVKPQVLKDKIKQAEDEYKAGKGAKKDVEFDPNMKILFDYLSSC